MKSTSEDLKAENLIEQYIQGFYEFYPGEATAIGVHKYDTELETRTRHAIEEEISRLERFLAAVRGVNAAVSADV